ncbi:GDSL-type esterase/lipase family protein [Butyrivibrio proteoclasticus]|uniref:GDSL-type esterase/lipase family protein n=1 Tax=Butyrivibrio proteoclasticus TaxID=43305 RepID=UPI00047EB8B7|nr:GDSL-type esterase/lipase family protein [Butyrivibrio proteoclasticus]
MKWLRSCPLLVGTAVTTIILSVLAHSLDTTVYADAREGFDPGTAPYFSLVFKGARDGLYPWSQVPPVDMQEIGAVAEASVDSSFDSTTNEELSVSGNDISGNDISGNDISGNDVSGNDADRTYEFTEVDPDYFCDALFIGDSRTVGLSEYCQELDERATFYAKVSLTLYKSLTEPFIKTDEGKISVEQALSEKQYAKIYIMLGLNEIGGGTPESYAEDYMAVIDRIRELQPDAIIYIQGIMHVTENKSENDKHFNNANINSRNEALSQLADNKTIFYIDMNEAVDDENGNLLADLSFDGVHLKAASYDRWYQFLLQHAIVK